MQRTAIRLTLLLACLGAAIGAWGCGDNVTTVSNIVQNFLSSTRANSILTVVNTYWFAPTGSSLNPHPDEYFHGDDVRVFCCSNGTAIYAFYESTADEADGESDLLYLGFIEADGTLHRPVCIKGDFFIGFFGTLVVVFNQHGDATIMFQAVQDNDPTDPDDVVSSRIYYTWFDADLASTADNGEGVEYGFNVWSTAIDRNVVEDDDDGTIGSIFVATNLIDGTLSSDNPIESYGCSGSRGLSLDFFLFIGWQGLDTSDVSFPFIEGHFIDLDPDSDTYLEVIGGNPTVIDTADTFVEGSDGLSATIYTSGRDILFRHNRTDNGGGFSQEVVNLVRVDATDPTDPEIGSPIAITRGQSDSDSIVDDWGILSGGGMTPFNGQTATWIWMREDGYTDTDVAADDQDLLIACIDDGGTVAIDEFDHDLDTGDDNPVLTGPPSVDIRTALGCTHALIVYGQQDDPNGTSPSTSLFATGVIFSDAGTFANLVSAATLISASPDDEEGDTDVLGFTMSGFETSGREAFCGIDSDPLDFGLAYAREQDDDPDLTDLFIADIVFDAVEAEPGSAPTLTVTETLVRSTAWGAESGWLMDGGNSAWVFVHFGQANSIDDSTEGFEETRAFATSVGLAGGDLDNVPLGSGAVSGELPFPDYNQAVFPGAIWLTERDQHAGFDFTWDLESAEPDTLHALLIEAFGSSMADPLYSIVYRAIDLTGTEATASDRLSPDASEAPGELVEGVVEPDVVALMTEGANSTVVLAEQDESSFFSGFDPRFFTVSTLDTSTLQWAERAPITNDIIEIADWTFQLNVVPGWTTTTCCERIIGGWIFYTRWDDDGFLQARRFHSLTLTEDD